MFKVLIMVCSMSVSPADCTPTNALETQPGPKAENEIQCMQGVQQSQMTMAGSALAPREGQEYLKAICMRTKSAAID